MVVDFNFNSENYSSVSALNDKNSKKSKISNGTPKHSQYIQNTTPTPKFMTIQP